MKEFTVRNIHMLCLVVLASLLITTTYTPLYPKQQYLQHLGTLIISTPLIVDHFRKRLSNISIIGLSIFITIHIIGARYIYSYVPYNDWSIALLGIDINETFGFTRNHYDRFVHFSFGLLLMPLTKDLVGRYFKKDQFILSLIMAWLTIQFLSLFYELFEWSLTMVMTSDMAENYNGQQGDNWDAHKDMALAMLGSSIIFLLFTLRKPKGN